MRSLLISALSMLVICSCAMATEQTTYIASGYAFTYDDTDVYGDGVTKEGIRLTGQGRVEEAPTDNLHVVRLTDMASSITATAIQKTSVADIDDPSTELNALSGTNLGELRMVYEDAVPSMFTIYAYDPGTGQTENVPYTVDASSGIWVAVAGRYQNDLFLEGLTVNADKGATNDFVVHGDTIDNALFVDVSTGVTYTSGTLRANGSMIVNAQANATANLTVSGDTGQSIISTNAANDRVDFGGSAVFNYTKNATNDFTIHGDTIDDIFQADVSLDKLIINGNTDVDANAMTFNGSVNSNWLKVDNANETLAFDGGNIDLEVVGGGLDFRIQNFNAGDADIILNTTDEILLDSPTVVNQSKGATDDFTVHGDTVDDLLFVDASGNTVYTSATQVNLNSAVSVNNEGSAVADFQVLDQFGNAAFQVHSDNGEIIINSGLTNASDVTIHGDTVNKILFADASADQVQFHGSATFNASSNNTSDVIINGDTVSSIFAADVSENRTEFNSSTLFYSAGTLVGQRIPFAVSTASPATTTTLATYTFTSDETVKFHVDAVITDENASTVLGQEIVATFKVQSGVLSQVGTATKLVDHDGGTFTDIEFAIESTTVRIIGHTSSGNTDNYKFNGFVDIKRVVY